MNEQIANLSREIKTVKRNLVGVLELKILNANMKSYTDSFKWQIKRYRRASRLEDQLVDRFQSERQKEKTLEKKSRASVNCGTLSQGCLPDDISVILFGPGPRYF